MLLRVVNVSQWAKLILQDFAKGHKCDDFRVELKIRSTLNDLKRLNASIIIYLRHYIWVVPEGEKNCIIVEYEYTCDEYKYVASSKGTVRRHKNYYHEGINLQYDIRN